MSHFMSRIMGATALVAVTIHGAPALGETAAQLFQRHVETHPSQGDIRVIDGAEAMLVTTPEGAFVTVSTHELKPGHAYTMWFVAINEPTACETSPCKAPDVVKRTALTDADIGFADGIVAKADGTGRFAAFQPVGALESAWFGNGLKDAMAAEIHLVIRDHGPLAAARSGTMLTTFRDGCTDASVLPFLPDTAKRDGAPGPNTCADVQDVVFVQSGAASAQVQ